MATSVVISAAGRCPEAAGGAKEDKNVKKRKICVCLIVFGGLSLGVFCGYFTKGVTKKHDDLVGTVLVEALARRFICFGENDVNPRVIQTCRIEGPGRG